MSDWFSILYNTLKIVWNILIAMKIRSNTSYQIYYISYRNKHYLSYIVYAHHTFFSFKIRFIPVYIIEKQSINKVYSLCYKSTYLSMC